MSNDKIIIEARNDTTLTITGGNLVSIKAKDEIRDEKILGEIDSSVEKLWGSIPKSKGNPSDPDHDKCTLQNIIQFYKNHPSIIKIKENFKNLSPFDFPKPTIEDMSLIVKSLNPRKAAGPDCIPLKAIKFVPNVIDSHLSNIIIEDLEKSKYSEELKTPLVIDPFSKKMKETKWKIIGQ